MAITTTSSVSIPNAHLRVPGPSVPIALNSADRSTTTSPVDSSGAITPTLLAKHHLPGILLDHGPMAIRYITAHLIQTLPGFSAIPPARQRRLVVGALEGRGVDNSNSEVIFEKVGWGRWDARRKGDPPRERQQATYSGETGVFIQSEEDEDVEMIDVHNESETASSDEEMEEDDDMTDEEDWAQMGPEALRMDSGSPSSSYGFARSFERSPGPVVWKRAVPPSTFSKDIFDQQRSREEREAIEALVQLSSV